MSLGPGDVVPFTDVERAKLVDYLEYELGDALDEHTDRVARLAEWQRAYDGDPKEKRKTFPWPGAANLTVPLIGIAVDSIVARIVNTIFMVEPFWSVRPLRKEVDQVAKPVEQYLDWSRKAEFNLYRAVRPWTIEVTKFGWGWLKLGWEVYTVSDYIVSKDGGGQQQNRVIRRPNVYHVMDQDMITQCGVEDEEQAEWICHRVRLTDNQMRMRRYDHIYGKAEVDKVLKFKEELNPDEDVLNRSDPNSAPRRRDRMNVLYEFCIDWPWGEGEFPQGMVITYHRPTKTILRAIFNPYGFRMYKKGKFIEREGKLEGFGIAKRLWMLQEELSTIHNQQVDNATVANTRFFLGKRGVVKSGTSIYPGKILLVGDPKNDLTPMQLGEVYPSMRALELTALSYAERASGVSDYQLGRESSVAGSGATATGTLALIQEGNRRFDLNIRDMRDALGEVGKRVLEINQRFRPRGAAYFVQGSDGAWTEEVLNLPSEFSASQLAVELSASTATINRETEKQGLIGLLGVVSNYYEKLAQIGMVVLNPNVPPEMKDLMIREAEGAKHLMKRIVQTFDVKSIDTVVPGLMPEGLGGLEGSSGSVPGGAADPSMAGLPGEDAGFASNGTGGAGLQ